MIKAHHSTFPGQLSKFYSCTLEEFCSNVFKKFGNRIWV